MTLQVSKDKYILIADIHLSAFSNEPVIKGEPENLYYTMIALDNIISYAREKYIKTIIIAGDVYHTKSVIHNLAQSRFLKLIKEASDLEFIILDGNHDLSSRGIEGTSANECFDSCDNVSTIHKSCKLGDFYFVPWSPTMVEDIKNKPENCKYLVAHLGLNEAQLNSGISIVSDLGLKDLREYDICFLGHYHKAQQLENVYYMGSIIQRDWGEKHDEKRFLVFDVSSGDVSSVPTVGYRKYFDLELTKENYKEVTKMAKELQEEGNHVKLSKIEDFDTSKIESNFRIVEKFEKDLTNRGINSTMSIDQIIDKYLDIKVPEDKREKYKKIALAIINSLE